MAHYNATVSAPRPAAEVFAYLVDFRTVAEWDPSMKSAELLSGGGTGRLGARYRLTIDTPGPDTVIDYEVVELEAPRRFVVRGETGSLVSVDTVVVTATAGGCDITYDAQLDLKGVRKLADPLMSVTLSRASDRARDGLRARLAELPVA